MARNGSGTYVLPAGNPVVSGTTINSSVQNATMTDIANALTTSVATDGQTPMAANLPMGGNKITGMATGTLAGDATRLDQVQALAAAIIPSGTNMLFQQTAAPVGWTKQTTHNDKALRVVSGAASSGGANAFSTIMTNQITSDGHSLTGAELGSHAHGVNFVSGNENQTLAHSHTNHYSINSGANSMPRVTGTSDGATSFTNTTDAAIAFPSHNHNVTGTTDLTGSGTAHSHTTTFNVAYVDIIICQKN